MKEIKIMYWIYLNIGLITTFLNNLRTENLDLKIMIGLKHSVTSLEYTHKKKII